MSAFQLADKGISTIKMTKSFRPPFSKGGAVEAAEASSTPAGVETPLSVLLFCELDNRLRLWLSLRSLFSFAPISPREKRLTALCCSTNDCFCNRICQYSEKQTAMSAFLFTKIKEYLFLDGNRSKSIDFLGIECYNKL
ncbi:MAG: hypothetical protein IJX19_01595 [Clostridia bacterium]|nr:hypothetical protein [Clostridia bacterium]